MPIVNHPNGQKTQERVMIEGSSLSGQGVGSKYTTRVVYFPVLKWHQDDDPLNDPCFPYYEGYFIEHVCEMLKKGKAMPSTKIRHDSCVSFGELLMFVHEAQSGSMQEEILKVVLGLCHMLPYSRRPHGIIMTDHDITWLQIEIDHANQRIVYKTQPKLIFDRSDPREHEIYVPCILEIVKQIAGILFYKQTKINLIVPSMLKSCDNPNSGSPNFSVQALLETEGLFLMETVAKLGLNRYKYADEVMFKAEKDYHAKVAPHIANVTTKLASP